MLGTKASRSPDNVGSGRPRDEIERYRRAVQSLSLEILGTGGSGSGDNDSPCAQAREIGSNGAGRDSNRFTRAMATFSMAIDALVVPEWVDGVSPGGEPPKDWRPSDRDLSLLRMRTESAAVWLGLSLCRGHGGQEGEAIQWLRGHLRNGDGSQQHYDLLQDWQARDHIADCTWSWLRESWGPKLERRAAQLLSLRLAAFSLESMAAQSSEDLVAEVMTDYVQKHVHRQREWRGVWNYLERILRSKINLLVTHMTREKQVGRAAGHDGQCPRAFLEDLADKVQRQGWDGSTDGGGSDAMLFPRLRGALQAAMDDLDEREQRVLRGRILDGLPYREFAHELGYGDKENPAPFIQSWIGTRLLRLRRSIERQLSLQDASQIEL